MFTNLLMLHLKKELRPQRVQHRDRCISDRVCMTLNPSSSDLQALIAIGNIRYSTTVIAKIKGMPRSLFYDRPLYITMDDEK